MIPLPTTTIALLAPKGGAIDTEAEDWGTGPDPETGYTQIASGIRAHLSGGSSGSMSFGMFTSDGNTEQIRYKLICDPCSLNAAMRVKDETTGLVYDVAWATPRPEPMSHVLAGVTRSTGTP